LEHVVSQKFVKVVYVIMGSRTAVLSITNLITSNNMNNEGM